ncbi:MAG TPA: 3',5'-cyclic-nucleotide phosphodiesterase [Thiobacillaceae bacterium]|nr:3',5'-cyclic-nucleotide phosphodiesterase [Thiobacillaceae bacterium]HNU62930.1 3',5'-cyclic-nucleotide phosphodiesterase [Thiobacillaceae bacterium]
MKIRVLGCSGGIGDGRHTTSFLVNDDVLMDCGTGVTTLSHAELCRVEHVFITHSHLDHICSLPLLLDSVAGERARPLTLHGLPEVLQILQDHVFNWRIWPDFARIPDPEAPFLRYARLDIGQTVDLAGVEFTPIPANHVVPAVGFLLRAGGGSLLFSGDTAHHEALWRTAATTPDLRHLVVECSFPDALAELAEASKHYRPGTLAPALARLGNGPAVWISHLKPAGEAAIMAELAQQGATRAQPLYQGQLFEL